MGIDRAVAKGLRARIPVSDAVLSHDAVSRGSWWAVYDDPVLDTPERHAEASNEHLKSRRRCAGRRRRLSAKAAVAYL